MLEFLASVFIFLLLESSQGAELLRITEEDFLPCLQLCAGMAVLSLVFCLTRVRSRQVRSEAIPHGRLSLIPAVFPFATVVLCYALQGIDQLTKSFVFFVAVTLVTSVVYLWVLPRHLSTDRPHRLWTVYRAWFPVAAPVGLVTIALFPVLFSSILGSLGSFLTILALYYSILHKIGKARLGRSVVVGIVSLTLITAAVWRSNTIREVDSQNIPKGGLISRCAGEQPLPGLLPVASAIDCWYDANKDEHGQATMVLVATAGGGMRAAQWTAVVLSELDRQVPRFSDHLFAISGVSGGAVGATLFRAALTQREMQGGCDQTAESDFGPELNEVLSRDLLAPSLTAWLTSDALVSVFGPLSLITEDRAAALEKGFERSWARTFGNDLLSNSFTALWPCRPWPALLINSTFVHSGQTVISSNIFGLEVLGFGSVIEIGTPFWRVSTTMVNSARFPLISPAGRMLIPAVRGADGQESFVQAGAIDNPGEQIYKKYIGSLVDGGYADNFGATSIMHLIETVDEWQCSKLRETASDSSRYVTSCDDLLSTQRYIRYIVVQITSDPAINSDCISPPTKSADFLANFDPPGITTPLLTLYNFRTQSGFTAAEALNGMIRTLYVKDQNGRFAGKFPDGESAFDTIYFHFSLHPDFNLSAMSDSNRNVDVVASSAPLHWSLSPSSSRSIQDTLRACGPFVVETMSRMLKTGMYIDRTRLASRQPE